MVCVCCFLRNRVDFSPCLDRESLWTVWNLSRNANLLWRGLPWTRRNACSSKMTPLGGCRLLHFCTVREVSSSDKGFEKSWLWLPEKLPKDKHLEDSCPHYPGAKVSSFIPPCNFSCFPLLSVPILHPVWSLEGITAPGTTSGKICRESIYNVPFSFTHSFVSSFIWAEFSIVKQHLLQDILVFLTTSGGEDADFLCFVHLKTH